MSIPVTVFHNEDAGFVRGYKPGDRIKRVHRTVELESERGHDAVLARLYERYNIGEGPDALAYRGVRIEGGRQVDDGSGKATCHNGQVYGIRSLSVGDVLALGGVFYSVEPCGFERVDL